MDILILFLVYAVPAAVLMGLLRLLGVKNIRLLLAAAAMGGGLAGAFIGSAVSALASAVDPADAMLRGGGWGLLAGLATGTALLGTGRLLRRG